jgi:GNAT superfamily N-acetyltransferase
MAAVDSREQARRIEAAQAFSVAEATRVRRASLPDDGLEAIEVGGGWAFFAGVESPVTKAEGLGMAGPVTAEDLDRVEAFFAGHGATPRVTVCPYADPSLLAVLGPRGYRIEELENVLVRPLDGGAAFPGAAVEISEVARTDAGERSVWAETIARGFVGADEVPPEFVYVMELFAGTPQVRCFLARVDGEPAGGGAVLEADGIASLFGASTIPAYRNRGIQTAALNARLAAAKGCDLAIVMTTPGSPSQRNVERAGFRVAYTKAGLVK